MKVTVIYGSPRKGSSYNIAQSFKEQMSHQGEVEFIEYFLPKDFPNFCHGCCNCLDKGRETCPNAEYTLPILKSMLEADALLFTSPVYVEQMSGCLKNFFDHFVNIFVIHRMEVEMLKKKAFIICTTAATGSKGTVKSIRGNLLCWGVNRIYSRRFKLMCDYWKLVKDKKKEKIKNIITKDATKFYKEVAKGKRHVPYFKLKFLFFIGKIISKKRGLDSLDCKYYTEKNWYKKSPF